MTGGVSQTPLIIIIISIVHIYMSCGFNTNQNTNLFVRKYKSLYLGEVEVPPVLETVYNGITIKVIDAKQFNINTQVNYSVDNLRYLPATIACDNTPAIDIFFNTLHYVKYLTKITGRLNINDNTCLLSLWNVDNLDNAFFTGSYMVYGNGATMMKPLVSIDVVSHELTHGLCQTICGLEYKGESGALNESLSDVIATGFEFYLYAVCKGLLGKPDFEIGEDIMKGRPNLRDMRVPRKIRDSQYVDPLNMQMDLGGVHLNSAVPNYLFYICVMVIGLNHMQDILSLWYRTYCRLPKDCTMLLFGKILREESPNKWITQINACLMQVGM
jgi:Zn-dependent metalloprotease